jgi:hypothetical protein
VWAYDQRKVFCVMRSDVTLEVDRSFYFDQDALAVRATIRVGYGFAHAASVVAIESGAS